MLPSRPRSRAAAASSARTAGADPSYPTTRYKSPELGMAVFIATPGFFQASERIVVLLLDRDRRHHHELTPHRQQDATIGRANGTTDALTFPTARAGGALVTAAKISA